MTKCMYMEVYNGMHFSHSSLLSIHLPPVQCSAHVGSCWVGVATLYSMVNLLSGQLQCLVDAASIACVKMVV